jgi:hypothetical protein
VLASASALIPWTDVYRPDLTPAGWKQTLAREWAGCEVSVEGYGNCLAAIAAMHGLAFEELTDDELAVNDPRFPVLVAIKCRKR